MGRERTEEGAEGEKTGSRQEKERVRGKDEEEGKDDNQGTAKNNNLAGTRRTTQGERTGGEENKNEQIDSTSAS